MLKELVRTIVPSYGYSLPDTSKIWTALDETKFTPDIARLEEYSRHLIFVADELKKDHLHHDKLGNGCEPWFPAYTQKNFQFWQPNNPLLSPIPTKPVGDRVPWFPPYAKIKGEVYSIPSGHFTVLDRYKQNTVEYQRERVRLIVPYRAVVWLKDHNLDPAFGVQETFCRSAYEGSSIRHSDEAVHLIWAWMYIGKRSFWDPLLQAYDYSAVETFNSRRRRWCETYYYIRRPALPQK